MYLTNIPGTGLDFLREDPRALVVELNGIQGTLAALQRELSILIDSLPTTDLPADRTERRREAERRHELQMRVYKLDRKLDRQTLLIHDRIQSVLDFGFGLPRDLRHSLESTRDTIVQSLRERISQLIQLFVTTMNTMSRELRLVRDEPPDLLTRTRMNIVHNLRLAMIDLLDTILSFRTMTDQLAPGVEAQLTFQRGLLDEGIIQLHAAA
jgi:hypothetical protein